MSDSPTAVSVRYNADHTGTLSVPEDALETPIWSRLKLAIRTKKLDHTLSGNEINLSWPDTLGVVRELGSKANQKSLHFRFRPEGEAADKLRAFVAQIKKTREQRSEIAEVLSPEEINAKLKAMGFTQRELRDFQLRDLSRLLALSNGANFSVPGAGKTTVTFALHMLTRKPGQHFIVVAPKAAFQAWMDIVDECMDEDAPDGGAEPFILLDRQRRRKSQFTSFWRNTFHHLLRLGDPSARYACVAFCDHTNPSCFGRIPPHEGGLAVAARRVFFAHRR